MTEPEAGPFRYGCHGEGETITEAPAIVVQVPGQPPAMFGAAFTLGRKGTDVMVPDDFASTRHAALWPGDSGWVAEDLGSTNGTWLNGQRIYGPHPVAKGDRIRIGRTEVIVVPAAP